METTIRAKLRETGTTHSIGFAPISRTDARVLILGSLPSQRSLAEGQYYGHPQNAFWRIMRELIGAEGNYEERCQTLMDHRLALWDVLASSVRPGSMDAAIRVETAQHNDFPAFFSEHRDLEWIGFNGQKAAQLFASRAHDSVAATSTRSTVLPSTSPAYASMSFDEKLDRWRSIIMI